MAKANETYIYCGAFEHHFENIPLLWERVASDIVWLGGQVDVTAEVSYDESGVWWISAVWVTVDNGQRGLLCRQDHLYIDPARQQGLYTMLIDSVVEARSTFIEDLVYEELYEEAT